MATPTPESIRNRGRLFRLWQRGAAPEHRWRKVTIESSAPVDGIPKSAVIWNEPFGPRRRWRQADSPVCDNAGGKRMGLRDDEDEGLHPRIFRLKIRHGRADQGGRSRK